MQEAFGGTFLLKLFMVFFVIYVTFIGVALNFAKTYRVKNHVIDYFEQYQYDSETDDLGTFIENYKLNEYLNNVPYKINDEDIKDVCKEVGGVSSNGICVVTEGNSTNARYYKIYVYFVAEFPFFNIKMTIPASGETKTMGY
jgi:hypothetical protein